MVTSKGFYSDLNEFLKSISANIKENSEPNKKVKNISDDLQNFLEKHKDRVEYMSL